MIVGHIGGSSGGYEIEKSLRFRASASAYLSRTPVGAGNRRTWTWGAWVKRGTLGTEQSLFNCRQSVSGVVRSSIRFTSANQLVFSSATAANTTSANCISSAVFRDPTSHLHVVIAVDTTQSVAADRVKLYVNGTLLSLGTATYPTQNIDLGINQTLVHEIGIDAQPLPFDGYMGEINFIDGQALTPDNFGEFSVETGQWIPKKYTGTHGTNGFYLPFDDGTDLTELTKDRSGNGNDWTAANISLTDGVTYDWMDDTQTNNFAVLNAVGSHANYVLSSASLGFSCTTTTTGIYASPATIAVDSGKWYWEQTLSTLSTPSAALAGIVRAGGALNSSNYLVFADGVGYKSDARLIDEASNTAYGATYTTGDVIGVALDMDDGTLTFYKNGVSQGVAKTGLSGTYGPAVAKNSNGTAVTVAGSINFGQRPFAHTPPTGFQALCTKNLPAPSIVDPKDHFTVATYTGDGTAIQTFSSDADGDAFRFNAGLIWTKSRSAATSNILSGNLDGNGGYLVSNTAAAAVTPSDAPYMAGSELGVSSNVAGTNANAATYVSWLWKSGSSAANTDGSISSTVYANQPAGFSIVKYTGTGANATVGHGLGVVPKMVIVKNLSTGSTNWYVYHGDLLATQVMVLNLTNAVATQATAWNSTAPDSSVFSLGTNANVNASGDELVAYCFAEVPGYSKIGAYTGNGSANGPFVYCGFKPKFVMIKGTNVTTPQWLIKDSARDPSNEVINVLSACSALQENEGATLGGTAVNELDFTATGFKLRDTHRYTNQSAGVYIFMAFAESPFNYSTAR